MENRINKIFKLENGKELMVLHQAIYNDDNYLVCSEVIDNEQDLSEEPILVHEIKTNDGIEIDVVEDPELAEFILQHLNLID